MRKFFVATVASLMLALVGSFAPIAAQSGDYVLVRSFICETDPGATTLVGLGGELPEYCAEAGGVRITISDESGAFFSECTTNDRGACSLQAPLGETITITEDVSTVPAGYAPNRNPIVEETDPQGAAGEWIREFVNVATDDTVTLPNTGTGGFAQAAQLGDELHMHAYLCGFDYEDIFVGLGGELPEDCTLAGGVRIFVTDQSGSVFSECTTNEQGACSLQVPLGELITVTEDVSSVPEGYTTPRNPFVVETPSWGVSDLWTREFINVAEDSVTLPSTGSGNAEHVVKGGGLPYLAVTFVLVLLAFIFWRRTARST